MLPLLVTAAALGAWPLPDAGVTAPGLPAAPTAKLKVVVDAGHGAKGNTGNSGVHCQWEADFTLHAARQLAKALEATGRFEVRLSRDGDAPSYDARLEQAAAWKADAVVSLHSDARGEAYGWKVAADGGVCFRNDDEPGYSVLWSEDGAKDAVAARERLGRALSRRLAQAGFLAYHGYNYGGLYRADAVAGGWVDLRPRKKSVYFLRAAKVPTVIVETHHALDAREVARWEEPATAEAFAAAVAAGVLDAAQPLPAQRGAVGRRPGEGPLPGRALTTTTP